MVSASRELNSPTKPKTGGSVQPGTFTMRGFLPTPRKAGGGLTEWLQHLQAEAREENNERIHP